MIRPVEYFLSKKTIFISLKILASLALLLPFIAHAKSTETLSSGNASLVASSNNVQIKNGSKILLDLSAFYFNYQKVDAWSVTLNKDETISLKAALPAAVDYYHTAFDNNSRHIEIVLSKVPGGFRFFANPAWGLQTSLEFNYLGDHFFGLTEALQPDNRLSPDLTGTSITVDVLSEAATMRENYASAFSAFYMSSNGYGAFYDSFAIGRYDFAINRKNRIHHDTGKLDWYVFVGDNGTEIHRHYFSLIGKPKHVPLWGLGPIGWRDQNNGGAAEILSDINKFTELQIPLTAWFVDRPYSDGNHAWSKMNFSQPFANPAKWIKTIREDYGLEFMTWATTATFTDIQFEKQFGGRYSYIDLSHPPSVTAYQKVLTQNQYDVGVRGHKIDRTDEVFAEHEEWFDGTPLTERRNKYTWLVAKTIHEGIAKTWQDNQLTFARSAIHRTQPYLSAIWGGDPRSTWDGLQGNFANAMRSSFMGFPVWGTDVGGYLGEGFIPEALYLRWMQFGSMTGLFEIKLDGSGGEGRDRMPWRYSEEFQAHFRAICEERMAFLPYVYSLASTSATQGVLMKPMAYQHLSDKNTWAIWDQFYLGDALLVAPILTDSNQRSVYFPKGQWRNFNDPKEVIAGGKSLVVEASLTTLPRYIKENSIYVLGHIYAGNSVSMRKQEKLISIMVNPAARRGESTFTYVDAIDQIAKPLTVTKSKKTVNISGPALSTSAVVNVYLDKAPKSILLNGEAAEIHYEANQATLMVPIPDNKNFEVVVTL